MRSLFRSIRPPDDITPNPNPPGVPPASVGPPDARPGDPNGVIVEPAAPQIPPPSIRPSAWSGWPAEWNTPNWGGKADELTDIAWACLDLNASVLSTMPPYFVPGSPAADTGWVSNPNPDEYSSWEEFAKQLFWSYQLGEAFVIATARYATGWPARFHVVPPWAVNVDMDGGIRTYSIGGRDVTDDVLHVRYQSSVGDAHGHGPLEAGAGRLVADRVFARYAYGFAAAGGIPTSVLTYPETAGELTADQARALKDAWIASRLAGPGEPAVLSGGVTFATVQVNPKDMGLVELSAATASRLAVLLGVPPYLVGLPSGGDAMTYQNVAAIFDYHWRASLRPKAQSVMAALSGWLLPRGTVVELNRDAYVQSDPESRARTYQILAGITGPEGPVISVDEIRRAERLSVAGAAGLTAPEVAE